MIVCIDPGHGGRDPGAIGRHPWGVVREVDVAWAVSMVVFQVLREWASLKVSREMTAGMELDERVRLINLSGSDLTVSIHCNSFVSSSARGFETLHFGSQEGEELAAFIHETLRGVYSPSLYSTPDRGLKVRHDLPVLRDTKMPTVLVELPFVSNEEDAAILVNPYFQNMAGRVIAYGVLDYLRAQKGGTE